MTVEQLEKRVEEIERELAKLKTRLEGMTTSTPWWERISGTFYDDAVYDEAMKLGRQYRCSRRPDTSEREGE